MASSPAAVRKRQSIVSWRLLHCLCSAVCCCWPCTAITFSWNDSTRCSSDISSCQWVFVYTAKLYRGMDWVTGPPHSLEQPLCFNKWHFIIFAVCLSLNCVCVLVRARVSVCAFLTLISQLACLIYEHLTVSLCLFIAWLCSGVFFKNTACLWACLYQRCWDTVCQVQMATGQDDNEIDETYFHLNFFDVLFGVRVCVRVWDWR